MKSPPLTQDSGGVNAPQNKSFRNLFQKFVDFTKFSE